MRIDIPAWFTTSVGDALTLPERATPEGSEIANALDQVDVDPEHPGTLDLPAGSYWVAASNAAITMASCPRTRISNVVPGVGTVATSSPSPT